MSTAPILAPPDRSHDPDQRVILNGIDWWQFETFLAIRGDRAGVRVTYLEGELEIMSPSRTHEWRAKLISRLLEAYADETGLVFEGCGSLTLRHAPNQCGIEPDEVRDRRSCSPVRDVCRALELRSDVCAERVGGHCHA